MDHQNIMKLHLLTLKFSGDSSNLEAPFQSEYFRASLPYNRAALVIGALFYSVFGILDVLLMPENKSTTWIIRFAIVDPVVIGTFLVSFSKFFERYVNPLMTCVSILAGGGIICMIIIAPPPVNYSYYAGLMLVFMWSYALVRISFLWASFAGWVLVVLYEIAAIWISPTPFAILLNNNFFFISANFMGMIACYSLEYFTRRDFFLTRQIEMEREKINRINRELESQTVEYQIVNRALEQEITDRKHVEEALRESEKRYRTLVDNASDIIFRTDDTGHFTFVNPATLRITGYEEKELIGKHYPALIHPDMRDETIIFFSRQFVKGTQNTYLEYPIITKEGHEVWLGQSTQLIVRDGHILGFQAVARDIMDRKRMEAEILALSITDQLTGLHNRRGFLSLAGQQLKLSDRTKKRVMLFFSDLDGMKWINDTLGHEEGDKALIEAAIILKETFRTSDIIARLGGDEFAALAIDITEENCEIFTARLQSLIDSQNNQENRRYRLSISVGCSYYDPENPCSIDELMASADKLMYEQKQNKKRLLLQGASLLSSNP